MAAAARDRKKPVAQPIESRRIAASVVSLNRIDWVGAPRELGGAAARWMIRSSQELSEYRLARMTGSR